MTSFSVAFRDRIGKLFGKELSVDEVRDLSPHFRRFRISAPWLRGASCAPGDKLQIMIAESGPRTYTPFAHDAASGQLQLLAYAHGDTPAAAWIRGAQAGTTFHAIGPRGSLPLASLQGPLVFFGDETSFAAASALRTIRGASDGVSFVFECSQPDEASSVLAELGMSDQTLVPRAAALAHIDAVESAVRAALAQRPGARLVLTGHAQAIQSLRKRLKAQPAEISGQTVKAYWADGKRGLD